MSDAPIFDVDPWSVGLTSIDIAHLAQLESVFGLSNGHVGWRGNLDEGDPRSVAGSYLNGVFEQHPMPYAEEGYGYPEHGQSIINVPNGQIIRLRVDDEPFDVREWKLTHHEQRLDLRAGTLHRDIEWTSPRGRTVKVSSTRIVSFTHRSIAAVRYRVTAVDSASTVTVQSELLANESIPEVHADPRVQEHLTRPLKGLDSAVLGTSGHACAPNRRERPGHRGVDGSRRDLLEPGCAEHPDRIV